MPQRIPTHKPPRVAPPRRRDDTHRPNAASRGYCDKRHRAWRAAVLTRDAWVCRHCGRVCAGHREAHADHIVPIAAGGERYDIANGQTLCAACHARKTLSEARAGKCERIGGHADHTDLRVINPGCFLGVGERDAP